MFKALVLAVYVDPNDRTSYDAALKSMAKAQK